MSTTSIFLDRPTQIFIADAATVTTIKMYIGDKAVALDIPLSQRDNFIASVEVLRQSGLTERKPNAERAVRDSDFVIWFARVSTTGDVTLTVMDGCVSMRDGESLFNLFVEYHRVDIYVAL